MSRSRSFYSVIEGEGKEKTSIFQLTDLPNRIDKWLSWFPSFPSVSFRKFARLIELYIHWGHSLSFFSLACLTREEEEKITLFLLVFAVECSPLMFVWMEGEYSRSISSVHSECSSSSWPYHRVEEIFSLRRHLCKVHLIDDDDFIGNAIVELGTYRIEAS